MIQMLILILILMIKDKYRIYKDQYYARLRNIISKSNKVYKIEKSNELNYQIIYITKIGEFNE